MIATYLATLPNFLLYFATAIVLVVVFTFIYTRITPHDEFKLIRENNSAAVLALLGAMAGFALPLASSIANSVEFVDFILWGLVAAIVQIVTYLVGRAIVSGVSDRISAGEVSAGAFLGGMSVVIGLLNAACMTY